MQNREKVCDVTIVTAKAIFNKGRLAAPVAGIVFLIGIGLTSAAEKILSDFEDRASLRIWSGGVHIQLSDEHVTNGKKCGKITLNKTMVANSWSKLPRDWSKYERLRMDLFNPSDTVALAIRIKDSKGKGYDIWSYEVPSGPHNVVIDLKKVGAKMDLANVQQFWFHTAKKTDKVLFIDNVRLTSGGSEPAPQMPQVKPVPPAPRAPSAIVSRRTPPLKPLKGAPFINLGIGGGGYMHSPSFSPYDESLMQTSCDMGGRYISRDGGRSWHMVPFWEIAGHSGKAVFDPKNIYIRGGGAINISPDKGRTWKVMKDLPWGREKTTLLKTVGAGGTRVAAGTDTGLWLSTDGAKTWSRSSKGKTFDLAHLGNTLFLAGDKALKVSRDLGKTWADISPSSHRGQIIRLTCGQDRGGMVLLALLEDKDTLLITRDWGKTWKKNSVGGTPERSNAMIEMASNQTRIVFINRRGELWTSSDDGANWKRCIYATGRMSPGVRESEFCGRRKWGLGRLNFAVAPGDTRRIIVTGMSDLFLSTDAGHTWKQMYNDDIGRIQEGSKDFFCRTRGLTMTSAWQFHVDPWDRNLQYMCYTDFGFIRSIDGGRSWATSPPNNSCYAIQFHPGSTRIYGAASAVHDIPGWGFTIDRPYKGGRVVYSDDRGDNWHSLGTGYPNIPCTYLELDRFRSTDKNLVFWATFYGNGGGLYRSDDSGTNWRRVKGVGYRHNDHFLEVRVHPKTGETYVSVSATRKEGTTRFETGGFWYSKDDGKNWTDIAKSLDLRWQARFAIVPSEPGTVYLSASTPPNFVQGGVYRTTNSGRSWKQVLDASIAKQVPYTSAGILQVLSVDVHPTKTNIIYACTKTHGLWCSRDRGETWEFIKVPHFRISHVSTDPDNPELIYVTTFGGGTWAGHYLP